IETVPLGTGGAVRQGLARCQADHVYVFNGDTYLALEAMNVEAYWKKHHAPIIVAHEMSDTARYGRLEIGNKRVLGFAEKGVTGPGLINAGCYVLPVHILDRFDLGHPFSLEADFLAK